jgi:competence protein ComEA
MDEKKSKPSLNLLRRRDQWVLAVLLLVAAGMLFFWWYRQGGLEGRTVEFKDLSPRKAEYAVDLNSAEWPELAQLPDIGETLAKRIVEYRREHGSFPSNDSLIRVRGIGPKTLESVMPYLVPTAGTETIVLEPDPTQRDSS